MFDWNWHALKRGTWYVLLLAALFWGAWATATLRGALAGSALALVVQGAIFGYGRSRCVGRSFDLARPLHRIIRWDNTWFRTLKSIVEMVVVLAMVFAAYQVYARQMAPVPEIVSFLVFGLLFMSAPVPLVLHAYYQDVLRASRHAMGAAAQAAPMAQRMPPPVQRPPMPQRPALRASPPVVPVPAPKLAAPSARPRLGAPGASLLPTKSARGAASRTPVPRIDDDSVF